MLACFMCSTATRLMARRQLRETSSSFSSGLILQVRLGRRLELDALAPTFFCGSSQTARRAHMSQAASYRSSTDAAARS